MQQLALQQQSPESSEGENSQRRQQRPSPRRPAPKAAPPPAVERRAPEKGKRAGLGGWLTAGSRWLDRLQPGGGRESSAATPVPSRGQRLSVGQRLSAGRRRRGRDCEGEQGCQAGGPRRADV